MENKKATIKRIDIGHYEIECKINKSYTISDLDGKLTIEEMKTKEQLAKQKAFEFQIDYKPWIEDLPYNEYAEEGFYQGFLAGQPKWISVETPPDFNIPVLIKYIKGKQGEVITQGYYQDEAQSIADRSLKSAQERGKFSENGIETAEFWRRNGHGLTWFDYSGRQIQYLGAKTSKNKVIQWMQIPN